MSSFHRILRETALPCSEPAQGRVRLCFELRIDATNCDDFVAENDERSTGRWVLAAFYLAKDIRKLVQAGPHELQVFRYDWDRVGIWAAIDILEADAAVFESWVNLPHSPIIFMSNSLFTEPTGGRLLRKVPGVMRPLPWRIIDGEELCTLEFHNYQTYLQVPRPAVFRAIVPELRGQRIRIGRLRAPGAGSDEEGQSEIGRRGSVDSPRDEQVQRVRKRSRSPREFEQLVFKRVKTEGGVTKDHLKYRSWSRKRPGEPKQDIVENQFGQKLLTDIMADSLGRQRTRTGGAEAVSVENTVGAAQASRGITLGAPMAGFSVGAALSWAACQSLQLAVKRGLF